MGCKVIPGELTVAQQIRKITSGERIKTWHLKKDENNHALQEMLDDRCTQLQGIANEKWE